MRGAVLVLLAGCGSVNLTGSWSGECQFEDYDMAIDLELAQEDDALSGDADADFSWQGYDFVFSGTATGTVVDDAVDLTLELGDGGTIEISADVASGSRIEGECSGDGGIHGGGWLER